MKSVHPFKNTNVYSLVLLNLAALQENSVEYSPVDRKEDMKLYQECNDIGLWVCKYNRFVMRKLQLTSTIIEKKPHEVSTVPKPTIAADGLILNTEYQECLNWFTSELYKAQKQGYSIKQKRFKLANPKKKQKTIDDTMVFRVGIKRPNDGEASDDRPVAERPASEKKQQPHNKGHTAEKPIGVPVLKKTMEHQCRVSMNANHQQRRNPCRTVHLHRKRNKK